MKRSILPVLLLAFFLAAMSSVSYADSANDDKVNPSDIVEMLKQQKSEELQQKQEKLDQLWKDVKESVAKKDYKTAITKLEEILKLDENSEDAKKILAILKGATPSSSPESSSQWGAGAKAGDRKVAVVNGVEFAFRWCPPGTFMMGSPTSEEGRWDNETQHQVTLTKGFWMMETEVTQKQWKAVMGNLPPGCAFKGDDLPVVRVSWDDCQEFCKKCTQLGLPVQLPTEAQWEYACRAGSTTAYFWGNALNGDKANCDGNYPCGTTTEGKYIGKTTPVGSYQPNAWGLYDMHGNVYEWCQDWYDKDYPSGSVTDPVGPSSGSNRVIRGGCWDSLARCCRSAYRDYYAPVSRNDSLGFRALRGQ